MSDSVRPHRWQPTRLPCPWDSPGKNTGVGCHFLPQCMKLKSESEVAQSCPTPSDTMDRTLPGSSFHGLFQARVLEWGAIAFRLIGDICHIYVSSPSLSLIHSFNKHLWSTHYALGASQVAQVVKNLPANAGDARDQETWVWSLGQEDLLE